MARSRFDETAVHAMESRVDASRDGKCVVVVDDDASIRHALARLMHLCGYVALTYPSAEALLESEYAQARCLVLDAHLPGLAGFELYRHSARHGTAPPVVFMTAYDEPESRAAARAAGAAAYLTKPFSGRALIDAVARANAGSGCNAAARE